MTQPRKEEPGIFDDFKEAAKQEFEQAKKDLDAGVDGAMRIAHVTLSTVKDTYKTVEDTVGRDRLWGAGFGAKAGGLFMATKPHPFVPGFIAQVGVGTIAGAAVGFVAGPWLAKRYRQANGTADVVNDNETDAAPKTPESKPQGPSLG